MPTCPVTPARLKVWDALRALPADQVADAATLAATSGTTRVVVARTLELMEADGHARLTHSRSQGGLPRWQLTDEGRATAARLLTAGR